MVDPVMIISVFIALVTGLAFHEFGHAAMSVKLGDPTPRLQKRLTLNPAAHLDKMGWILIIIMSIIGFGFAYGKPVQTNPSYYQNKRAGRILTAIAGPAMNLALVMLAIAFAYSFFMMKVELGVLSEVLFMFIYVNLILMIFNLIPIPPLDGHHVLEEYLPWRARQKYRQLAGGLGLIIILGLWFTGVLRFVIGFVLSLILMGIGLAFGGEFVNYLMPRF
jgi:Zn-dependent protease